MCITKRENFSDMYILAVIKLNSFINTQIQFPLSCCLHLLIQKNSKEIKFSKLKSNLRSQD